MPNRRKSQNRCRTTSTFRCQSSQMRKIASSTSCIGCRIRNSTLRTKTKWGLEKDHFGSFFSIVHNHALFRDIKILRQFLFFIGFYLTVGIFPVVRNAGKNFVFIFRPRFFLAAIEISRLSFFIGITRGHVTRFKMNTTIVVLNLRYTVELLTATSTKNKREYMSLTLFTGDIQLLLHQDFTFVA